MRAVFLRNLAFGLLCLWAIAASPRPYELSPDLIAAIRESCPILPDHDCARVFETLERIEHGAPAYDRRHAGVLIRYGEAELLHGNAPIAVQLGRAFGETWMADFAAGRFYQAVLEIEAREARSGLFSPLYTPDTPVCLGHCPRTYAPLNAFGKVAYRLAAQERFDELARLIGRAQPRHQAPRWRNEYINRRLRADTLTASELDALSELTDFRRPLVSGGMGALRLELHLSDLYLLAELRLGRLDKAVAAYVHRLGNWGSCRFARKIVQHEDVSRSQTMRVLWALAEYQFQGHSPSFWTVYDCFQDVRAIALALDEPRLAALLHEQAIQFTPY